jgi:hypothetical protein
MRAQRGDKFTGVFQRTALPNLTTNFLNFPVVRYKLHEFSRHHARGTQEEEQGRYGYLASPKTKEVFNTFDGVGVNNADLLFRALDCAALLLVAMQVKANVLGPAPAGQSHSHDLDTILQAVPGYFDIHFDGAHAQAQKAAKKPTRSEIISDSAEVVLGARRSVAHQKHIRDSKSIPIDSIVDTVEAQLRLVNAVNEELIAANQAMAGGYVSVETWPEAERQSLTTLLHLRTIKGRYQRYRTRQWMVGNCLYEAATRAEWQPCFEAWLELFMELRPNSDADVIAMASFLVRWNEVNFQV